VNAERGDAGEWPGRLVRAHDEPGVVEICRDYMESRPDGSLGELPESCAPRPIVNPADVADFALRLVRAQCDGARASATLEPMAAFFGAALARLSQLTGGPVRSMFDRGSRTRE